MPSVTFDSRTQCTKKMFNENVASHVRGVDYLDVEINALPRFPVENRQHSAIRG
jgi:hypothetical protein